MLSNPWGRGQIGIKSATKRYIRKVSNSSVEKGYLCLH